MIKLRHYRDRPLTTLAGVPGNDLYRFGTVGSLMGNLVGGAMMIEGRIARMAYISLYRMHQVALHGWFRTIMISVIGRINKIIRPRLKLH